MDVGAGRSPGTGYRFKAGKLYVFEKRQVAVICGAPQAQAVYKRADSRWLPFEPVMKLVHPYRPRRRRKNAAPVQQELPGLFEEPAAAERRPITRIGEKRRALDAFRFSLDKDVARRLAPLPNRQFSVLRCLQQHAWFDDLLASNRPLAFVVANPRLLDRTFDPQQGNARQRELMELFGFPGSKSAVQILRRMSPESLHAQHLRALRALLAEPDRLKRLRHAAKINAGVVQVLADDAVYGCVTATFIDEVAQSTPEKHYPRAAEMVRELLHLHGEVRAHRPPPTLPSLERAEALHTELGQRYERLHRHRILACRFPKPPVAGSDTIVPLRTPRDLVIEGEEQHNCVATYSHWVEEREVYIYRVLGPQRATLSLRRQPDGSWEISELLAACNRRVHGETRQTVEDWLYQI